VVAERGKGGGWGLLEQYQTTLTGLNLAEIQALFLPKPAHLLTVTMHDIVMWTIHSSRGETGDRP
jgi:hypothetical protein